MKVVLKVWKDGSRWPVVAFPEGSDTPITRFRNGANFSIARWNTVDEAKAELPRIVGEPVEVVEVL